MKEQVIASRPSRRTAASAKGFVQRPTRRGGRDASRGFSVRALFSYLPTALKFVLAILTIVTLAVGYRVASSASLFQIRTVDVEGTSRTSAEEIEGLVRRAVSKTGVWRANLSALSLELGRLPGVRHAVVTRVLPDGLRVRISERVPIAVVRTSAGHFIWVDEDGVGLGEMKATDQMPPFFIRGWNEEGTTDAAKENVERVKKYFEAVREWQAVGLAERVSEINLIDVHDVRAQLSGKDSDIEVRLGAMELGERLKTALKVLDEYKQTPQGPLITYVELQGDRVRLALSSGSKISAGEENSAAAETGEDQTAASTTAAASVAVSAKKNAATNSQLGNKKPAARATPAAKLSKDRRPRPR
jgi:cell division protein FtsQ